MSRGPDKIFNEIRKNLWTTTLDWHNKNKEKIEIILISTHNNSASVRVVFTSPEEVGCEVDKIQSTHF